MSQPMVPILSVNGYMKKYAVDGIGKGADKWAVRRQMLDEFRKEIFNLAMCMVGPEVFSDEYVGTDKERKKLENIIDNANKKWRSLCREFEKYRETSGILKETDLQDYLEERLDIANRQEIEAAMDEGVTTAHMASPEEMEAMTSGYIQAADEETKAAEDLREDVIHDAVQEGKEEQEESANGSDEAE